MRIVWDLRSEPDIQLCGLSMNTFDIATFLQVIIMTGSGEQVIGFLITISNSRPRLLV
jgi:hypothetical protein